MLLKWLANYVYTFLSLQGLPKLSFPLDCGLGAIAVCTMQVAVSAVEKGPSGISPWSQEHGSRDDLGKRVLEWENKNKQNPKSLSSWHLKSELSPEKGSEGRIGVFYSLF